MAMSSEEPGAAADSPYLVWSFKEASAAPRPDESRSLFAEAVTLTGPRGTALWRRPLPRRMQESPVDPVDASNHRRDPRRWHDFATGVFYRDDAVFIADRTGVLGLRRRDGAVVLDYAASTSRKDFFYFDQGRVTIRGPRQVCRLDARSGRFFAPCDGKMVYFNGGVLALFATQPFGLEEDLAFDAKAHGLPTRKPGDCRARMRLGPVDVVIEGVVHLR